MGLRKLSVNFCELSEKSRHWTGYLLYRVDYGRPIDSVVGKINLQCITEYVLQCGGKLLCGKSKYEINVLFRTRAKRILSLRKIPYVYLTYFILLLAFLTYSNVFCFRFRRMEQLWFKRIILQLSHAPLTIVSR